MVQCILWQLKRAMSTAKRISFFLLLTVFAPQAHSALISYASNQTNLVYSTVSNVTWTKDGNTLGAMFANRGFNVVVDDILSISPMILNTPNANSPTGIYTLSRADFTSDGGTTWFGAQAYINYLNKIGYAGSNEWRLPTVVDTGNTQCNDDSSSGGAMCGYNVATNGSTVGDELPELYYNELDSKAGTGIKDSTNRFVNIRALYWAGNEYVADPYGAWGFDTRDGYQDATIKNNLFYTVWAVSTGQISPIPEPATISLLTGSLALIAFVLRRRQRNY